VSETLNPILTGSAARAVNIVALVHNAAPRLTSAVRRAHDRAPYRDVMTSSRQHFCLMLAD
jgi:hypothetical protein